MTTSSDEPMSPSRTRRVPPWQAGRVVPLFLLIALAVLLALYSTLPYFKPHAKAETQTVFGPRQYERTTGPPNVFTDSFTVASNIGPPFHLHIDNGLPDGTKRVSSGSLSLNGVEVVSPSELSQRAATIEKEVTLQTGSNTLEVRLTSAAGSLLTVTITGTVTIPPSLDTVNPNTGTPGQSLIVSLSASHTSFQAGVTEASFGPNISVGGDPEGTFGLVTVNSATSATANITIDSMAALGPRTVTVRTGTEEVSKVDGFTVLAPGPVARPGTTVSTIAGAGTPGFADGQGTAAVFNTPHGIARDGTGNLYVADTNNHRIRKIAPDGTVSSLAGSGSPGLVNGVGPAAQFDSPEGVAAAADGTVYVADTHNHVIRKILPNGTVSTLAGTGVAGYLDGAGSTAQFDTPRSLALRPDGFLVVGDEGNNRVRLVDPATGTVSTLAGSGTRGFLDGAGNAAQFASMSGVAADTNNHVYVADTANQRIRKIDVLAGTVSTVAGSGAFGFLDGPAMNAQFADPFGVVVDEGDNVYVADAFNSLIRRITPGGQVETIAGSGLRGFDDGPGTTATFRTPHALVTGAPGEVFITDTGNHAIRLVEIGPAITTLDPTSGVQQSTFTLTVTGTDLIGTTALTFLKAGIPDPDLTAGGLSVDPSGTTLTASVTIAANATPGTRVVTVTTPGGTSSSTGTAANTFTVLGKLILSPDPITVAQGDTVQLTVSILNPAPAGGVQVTLESAGPSIATVTSPVTIPEGATSTTATVTGATEGLTNITVRATGFADAIVGVSVTLVAPTISSFTPGSGKVGATVTITGTGFRFTPANNTVSFTGPNDTRVNTPVTSATSTQLVVAVPSGAITGSLQVSTTGGTATSTGHFIVLPSQDFTLSAVPGAASTLQGGQVIFSLNVTAQEGFTGLVALSASGLPAGASAVFSSPSLAPGQLGTMTVTASGTTPTATSTLTVSGTSTIEGAPVTHTAAATLQVLSAGPTAVAGQITVVDGTPIHGVRVSLGSQSTTTDAGGNFLLQNLSSGTQTISIDANVARPGFPIYGVDVTLSASQTTVLRPFRITPPPPPERFTPFNNATQAQVITDPRFPGVSFTLPAGATITGWDGTPKSQMAIEKLTPDKLPVPPPPGPTRTLYQPFFGTPMGGLPSAPIPVTLPNDLGLQPGEKAELWYYDAAPFPGVPGAWRRAGLGTASADGQTIATDAGVGIERFCGVCGIACFIRLQVGQIFRLFAGSLGGEPVDLATGQFVVDKTDLVLPGRLPVTLSRHYHPVDPFSGVAGFQSALGTGWYLSVDAIVLQINLNLFRLVMPGNSRLEFVRQPDGTFRNTTHPFLSGAVLSTLAGGDRQLRYKDGTTWRFRSLFQGLEFLIEQADRNGNKITIERDSTGRVQRIVEPAGRVLNVSGGQISEIRDPLGRTVQYGYTGGRLTTVTDPAGGVTRYTYDSAGRILTIIDPRGITFLTNEYSASGRVTKQTQPDGGVWLFRYQLQGATVSGPGCPGPSCPTEESAANIAAGFSFTGGEIIATTVVDPRANATTHRFASGGFTSEITDALGQTTRLERDAAGNVISTTDPLGRVTRFTYDASGNVTSITDPTGNMRMFAYEPTFTRITSVTDPLGNVTQFAYDTNGNLTAITDPLGNARQIAYNQFGQPISTTDPLTNTTTFTYDTVGNLTGIVDPLGNTTTRTYDIVSRLVVQTDPRGQPTRFFYDELNHIGQIVDALNRVTALSYDGNGNLLTVTDARGSVTTHTYDNMDRLATRTDPLGNIEVFTHDTRGNLISLKDGKNQVHNFGYEALNRRTGASYSDGSATTLTYDAAGRLIQVTDTAGETNQNVYDIRDRLVTQTTPRGTASYAYDAVGRRTSLTVEAQPPVVYSYDSNSRLTQITQAAQTVTIAYDVAGRRTFLSLPNAVSTEYHYDMASRLTTLIYRNSAGVLGNLTYQYDPAGNRIAMGGSLARVLLPDPVATASYDAANRQVSFAGKTMTYDDNGNLTTLTDSTDTTNFTWDARNRLIALGRPGLTFQATYDTANRRILQVSNGQSTAYLYDGPDVAQSSGPAGIVNYLASLRVDEPLIRAASETYLMDALGSVVAVVNADGVITAEYSYSPFGVTQTTGGPIANSFKYTGREEDPTGLYFYRARYYDPLLKRFISKDPRGLASGVNSYAYVGNNPVAYTDPFGLCRDPGGKGIRFCLETFIPLEEVGFGIKGDGDDRSYNSDGGSFRTHWGVNVDLQSRTSGGVFPKTGMTVGPLGLEGQATGSTLQQSIKVTSDGGAVVRFSGNEAIPTVRFAPGITLDLKVKISNKGEMCVQGSHDGFPAFELWVYREGRPPQLLHGWPPDLRILRETLTPLALFGDVFGQIGINTCP